MTAAPLPKRWCRGEVELLHRTPTSHVYRIVPPTCPSQIAKCLTPIGRQFESTSAAYLKWRCGRGTIKLLDEEGDALLLEDAGDTVFHTHWKQIGDDGAFEALGNAIAELHSPVLAPHPAFECLEMRLGSLFEYDAKPIDGQRSMFDEAAKEARLLLASTRQPQVMHGDLHHNNLMVTTRGNITIDPQPVVGDPAYEAANLFSNPRDETELLMDPSRAERLAHSISKTLEYDVERLLRWGFVHSCLSVAWTRENGSDGPGVAFVPNRLATAKACLAALGRSTDFHTY